MTSTYLPMLPTLTASIPHTANWLYEVKYDGYRTFLYWDGNTITLTSRNGHNFNKKFQFLHQSLINLFKENNIPLCVLDGEVCVLKNRYFANFEALHTGQEDNLSFMAFDLIEFFDDVLLSTPLNNRKTYLQKVMKKFPPNNSIYYVDSYNDADPLWNLITSHNGEGMVCKKADSIYSPGKRTKNWLKVKNWKIAFVFLHAYDQTNGYFHVAVKRSGDIYQVANFTHGLRSEERTALFEVMKLNKVYEKAGLTYVDPGIVIQLKYLDLYKEKLRHPRFHQFCFDRSWEECTWDNIQSQWEM
ncbi:RNA ligase family protein [Bacillus sp. N1-1]|jgi:DNA ligase D-like protein (predicted ligase)|uniref:ATP-dependent DNA ligase n=1 Tax=Bacillus sp. N1-1 TaxID=2682541 RepID=UPI0013189E2F|nr:RNA ligase family protein [Bacillus sp. N1-1]QHA91524.1 hypothetical protein GNK04_08855 [Bacillus sp. N1-1]